MDPRLQSSFIPKKPVMAASSRQRGPVNLISLIATIIFILAILAAAGAYFYGSYLNNKISSDETSLNLTKGEFDPTTINQIVRLDSRLTVASSLLTGHVAVSNFFTLLEQTTLQTVRFTSFSFETGDQNAITVTMKGEAKSFSDVALETAALSRSTYFKNIVVDDLAVTDTGAVSFSVGLTVDPKLLTYVPAAISTSTPAVFTPTATSTAGVASTTPLTATTSTTTLTH